MEEKTYTQYRSISIINLSIISIYPQYQPVHSAIFLFLKKSWHFFLVDTLESDLKTPTKYGGQEWSDSGDIGDRNFSPLTQGLTYHWNRLL